MEEDSEDRESDEREAEATAARAPVSATLMGVVLGELGWDWANLRWAWSRGLGRSGRAELAKLAEVARRRRRAEAGEKSTVTSCC